MAFRLKPLQKQLAFSLVEVLIAFLILAIGMLAFAAAEIMGQRGTHSALKRSHATTLANDLAERMHANPTGNYIQSLSRDNCPVANIPVCSVTIANSDNAVQNCTADEMASYDLATWFCGDTVSFRSGVVTLLGGPETDNDFSTGPSVTANIACPDATGTPLRCPPGSAYSISLSWQEREPNRDQSVTNRTSGPLLTKTLEIVAVP